LVIGKWIAVLIVTTHTYKIEIAQRRDRPIVFFQGTSDVAHSGPLGHAHTGPAVASESTSVCIMSPKGLPPSERVGPWERVVSRSAARG